MRLLATLGLALLLAGCARLDHTAQAPRRPRHYYEHQQRRHEHRRHRTRPSYLPWN